MEILNTPNGPAGDRYRTVCFHCNADFLYNAADIHRNPFLRRRVEGHGFTNFTGEVRCPGCGTFLPHYEQNLYGESNE